MDIVMQCDQIRETFPELTSPPQHVEKCKACREEWELHLRLRNFRAPELDANFDRAVLQALDSKGFFEPDSPTWLERTGELLQRFLTPLAVAACVLLFLWMGRLAWEKPAPELRALQPEQSKLWSSLPDAVPPPALPGPAPSQRQVRLVKGDAKP